MSGSAKASTQVARVLLVEDELDDAAVVRAALPASAGYDVEHVRSGEDALDEAQQSAFDVIIVDHRLGGLSGVEVVRTLRQRGYAGAVVLMSSVAQDSVIEGGLAAGADEFVLKGLDMRHAMRDAVDLLLER